MVQLIIGHTTSESARLWIRPGDASASATITVWDDSNTFNQTILLDDVEYDTGIANFIGLSPNTFYQVEVIFEKGSSANGSFTTMPIATDSFNFLLGSCHYSYGTDHVSPEFERIGEIAKENNAIFQINAGDQIYIDTSVHPFWITSEEGYKERYQETWHSEPLINLFGTLPQYMVIDDHEIFNDFSNDNLNEREQQWFEWAKNTYRIFQDCHNPCNYAGQFYYSFDCAHASFFIMDLRTGRTGNNMISGEQLSKLASWINDESVSDKIKFLVSSVPLITQLTHGQQKDKWSGEKYYKQRDVILQLLMQASNKKIVVLAGDIHLSAHTWIEYSSNGKTYRINEIISSPIKQIQFYILSHEKPTEIMVNEKPLKYVLGNHMGYPFKEGEKRFSLRNNIMSINVQRDAVSYKVYAVNGKDFIFEGSVVFEASL